MSYKPKEQTNECNLKRLVVSHYHLCRRKTKTKVTINIYSFFSISNGTFP